MNQNCDNDEREYKSRSELIQALCLRNGQYCQPYIAFSHLNLLFHNGIRPTPSPRGSPIRTRTCFWVSGSEVKLHGSGCSWFRLSSSNPCTAGGEFIPRSLKERTDANRMQVPGLRVGCLRLGLLICSIELFSEWRYRVTRSQNSEGGSFL